MMKVLTMALLSAALAPAGAVAQAQSDHTAHHATSAAAAAMAEGEVRKIDKEQRKITLKHGPIANLDMPPMTMVFRAADPAMLDRVKAGDRIRFAAEKVGGEYTVTRIEPSK